MPWKPCKMPWKFRLASEDLAYNVLKHQAKAKHTPQYSKVKHYTNYVEQTLRKHIYLCRFLARCDVLDGEGPTATTVGAMLHALDLRS